VRGGSAPGLAELARSGSRVWEARGKRKGKEKKGEPASGKTPTLAVAKEDGRRRATEETTGWCCAARERKKGKSGHRRLPGEEPGRRSKMYLQQSI
jgi:hypothetical protein